MSDWERLDWWHRGIVRAPMVGGWIQMGLWAVVIGEVFMQKGLGFFSISFSVFIAIVAASIATLGDKITRCWRENLEVTQEL